MGRMQHAAVIIGTLLLGGGIADHAQAQWSKGSRAQNERRDAANDIPVCQRPLGTLSVIEPEGGVRWWTGYELPEPSRLVKVYVSRSRCFTLVDRGAGLAASQYERELGASGALRNRSNVGQGQIRAADYVMVPDLVSQNANAGGTGMAAGLLGNLLGDTLRGLPGSTLVGELAVPHTAPGAETRLLPRSLFARWERGE